MTTQNISLQLNLDQELTPYEEASTRIAEIVLEAPASDESFQRSPLNLALILDRSGSMRGEKLDYVKQAASFVLDLLDERDRLALVDYDDHVRVLFKSDYLNPRNHKALLKEIQGIRSGGMTNLSGGWLTGCQQVAEAIQPGTINQALLLTDGLANVGITEPHELATHARELAQRGVFTSTFGVGAGFNHHLLEEMANQGEGRFYFIENPGTIPVIFENEFKEILDVFANEIESVLTFPAELAVSVLGDWRHESPEPGKLRLYLGSLPAGRKREIYVKLSIPAAAGGRELPLNLRLMARGEQGRVLEAESGRVVRMTSRQEAESAPKDEALLSRFAQVEMADLANKALKMEQEGRRQEASDMLHESLDAHRMHLPPSVASYYGDMSQRMRRGMDELDRKRSHSESYLFKQRRRGYQTYHLTRDPYGRLTFNLDGKRALLDTGSPTSLTGKDPWEFMGRQMPGSNDLLTNPSAVSRKLGAPVDILLGMDVLLGLHVLIDVRNRTIVFSNDPLPGGDRRMGLEMVGGSPAIVIQVNGSPKRMLVDTGARLSYLRQEALVGLRALGVERDYHSITGEIETQVYAVPAEIAGARVSLRCGTPPPPLEQRLLAHQIDGMLGTQLFDDLICTFDLQAMRFLLRRD